MRKNISNWFDVHANPDDSSEPERSSAAGKDARGYKPEENQTDEFERTVRAPRYEAGQVPQETERKFPPSESSAKQYSPSESSAKQPLPAESSARQYSPAENSVKKSLPEEEGVKTEEVSGSGYVRGWLVCSGGILEGEDFCLTEDVSWIGSGDDADVRISVQDSAFGKRQFVVVYDRIHADFFILPEDGRLLYCNGKEVISATRLAEGDIIQSGSLSFEFVPFCYSGHSWGENM